MPYRSIAQARKFHADPRLRRFAPEFDAASRGLKLPARAGSSPYHKQLARFHKRMEAR